jgi:hypothetical protein
VSYQPAEPGQNSYYAYVTCDDSWQFQFEVKMNSNDSVSESVLDVAFQNLVTAINGASKWTVNYAKKTNADDQQVTP